MTAILRLQLDDKDPVRVNSAINQLAEYIDRSPSAGRTPLTANATFYVATTGSDANPGTSGSPFLTIQHAYDVIAKTIDTAGFITTISCASGTYTTGLSISVPWTGYGLMVLDLGGGTINSAADCINVTCPLPNRFTIQNGTLRSSGGNCIYHFGSGLIYVGTGVTFSSAQTHMSSVGSGSTIQCLNPYTITGGAAAHYLAILPGNLIYGGSAPTTVTITGTPAFSSSFVTVSRLGLVDIEVRTFTGSATGIRYAVDSNGVIFTNGGGANYFPGSIAGIPPSTGGQYL